MARADGVHVFQSDERWGWVFTHGAAASPGHGGAGHASQPKCGAPEPGSRTQVSILDLRLLLNKECKYASWSSLWTFAAPELG